MYVQVYYYKYLYHFEPQSHNYKKRFHYYGLQFFFFIIKTSILSFQKANKRKIILKNRLLLIFFLQNSFYSVVRFFQLTSKSDNKTSNETDSGMNPES